MRWLILFLALAGPAAAESCRTDAGFLYKLTSAHANGHEVFVGVGQVVPKGRLPEPPRPIGLDPESGEITPSTRPGPIPAAYLFSGDLHGPGGRERVDGLEVALTIACIGFDCTTFPGTRADPLEAYFIFLRKDGRLEVDAGPCKGFSRTLTQERADALLSCASGGCRAQDWAAFCDRQSYTPMHVCIAAGLLVRDPQTGRFVPSVR